MKKKAAIIGSGNIGADLSIKIARLSDKLEMAAMVGVDPSSDGLARARRMGIATFDNGIEGLVEDADLWRDIEIVFDATSAKAHAHHDAICQRDRKRLIDLTPAAIGPYCVPVVNMDAQRAAPNVNMVTCGGQATIPIVRAIADVSDRVPYAEIVASIASKSAGPGTRANIDEFTQTTARGVEVVGGAARGKAIIILNPAEPPLLMRNTVFVFSEGADPSAIEAAIDNMVAQVQTYVPGYRLKQRPQFEHFGGNQPLELPGFGALEGVKTSVFIEVEGAAHYLPSYAGNLDIMTSAALATGERIAEEMPEVAA